MTFLIINLLLGILASMIQIYSFRRDWYMNFGEDYFKERSFYTNFFMILIYIPFGIISLPIMLIFNRIFGIGTTFYFKIPEK